MILRVYHIVFALWMGTALMAQLPATDLFAVRYTLAGESGIVRSVHYLTDFNEGGYNNQPFVSKDGWIYLSTDYYEEGTEIARLDPEEKILERMTFSSESEYSPTMHPADKAFTTVRVEMDSSQTLMAYSLKSGRNKSFAPSLNQLAYYQWIDKERAAVVVLPQPMTFGLYDRKNDSLSLLVDNVGRCVQYRDGNVYFTQRAGSQTIIKSYDLVTGNISSLAPALEDGQDFLILPGQRLLMAQGAVIHTFREGGWQPLLDLAPYGLTHITRLAARRGELIIVNRKK